jgi:hypothetical protein
MPPEGGCRAEARRCPTGRMRRAALVLPWEKEVR